jgi:hypothetical protein
VPPPSKISRADPSPFCTDFLVVNYYERVGSSGLVQKLKGFWTAGGLGSLALLGMKVMTFVGPSDIAARTSNRHGHPGRFSPSDPTVT